ncbi:MAG: inorganic phosphate transporter [Peptococcaceae bacterium]|nr:inorganic phosphate transporter [Peptococcaceae bacterium]
MLLSVIAVAILFAFINGFHDGGNVFATAVSSRSVHPAAALILCTLVEFGFPLIGGTAVASTIGKGILSEATLAAADTEISLLVIMCALLGAMLWNLITWKLGLPSSSSHALIGGLIGAGVVSFGFFSVEWEILFKKIILVLVATPFIGFAAGFLIQKLLMLLFRRLNKSANRIIKRSHYLSMTLMACAHSSADSQKTMGVITLVLLFSGKITSFEVPFWVEIASSAALALGLFFCGWRIILTVGGGIFKLQPLHSLTAQISAAAVVYGATMLGGAVSTSQVVSSTIMGVGSANNFRMVKWNSAKSIALSWLLTIPAAFAVSAALFLIALPVIKLCGIF